MFIFTFEEVARFSLLLVPHWQDFRLILFEQRLFSGVPNLWLMRFASRPLSEFMDMGYFLYYPLFPVVAGALYARRDKKPFHELVLASVLMYLIAFTAYLVFPCEGPRRALPGFHAPPSGWLFSFFVRTIQGGASVHGNALPSSHVALAMLCGLAASRHIKNFFPFVAASTCLICISAVYDGYHYASDVLAGIVVALISAGLVHARPRLRAGSLHGNL
jgi:membrane-associated phospholipid phosphatase